MAVATNLTEYAKKYGQLPGSNTSGYTPLDYSFTAILSPEQAASFTFTEQFQRKKLAGFTTRELTQLDAISSRDLRPSSLENGIISLLAKDRWEKTPPDAFTRPSLYPLRNGNGLWIMDNPEVERIMTPVLILSSRILMSIHLLPWFDALVDGERRPIPDHRIPKQWDYIEPGAAQSFHTRHSYDPDTAAARRDRVFELLISKWNFTLGFSSPTEDVRGPHFDDENGPSYGCTLVNQEQMSYEKETSPMWGIWSYMVYTDAEHLFRDDLNSADRMCVQWVIATTIVHEVMHAISITVPGEQNLPILDDPYFEDQAYAEAGFAFEYVINGGTAEPFVDADGCLPLGYWLKTDWPSLGDRKTPKEDSPRLINPGPILRQRRFPIPVSLYSDIQQEAFWSIGVRAFGHGLFFYRNMQEGAQRDWSPGPAGTGYGYTISDPVRIGATSNFSNRAGEMTRKLEELRLAAEVSQLASFSPDDRKLLEFGKHLLVSSQVESEFWTNTVLQREGVKTIFDHIEHIRAGPADNLGVFRSLVSLMAQIRENHEIMVASTPSLEEINGVIYTDRRKDLLAWNRGTRIFIKRLQGTSKSVADPTYHAMLGIDLIQLERCRMNLWYPGCGIQDVFDHYEIETLMRARNAPGCGLSIQDCKNICTALLNDAKTSPTVTYCARMILLATEPAEAEGLQRAYQWLQQVITQFAALRWGAGSGWKGFLETWEAFATRLSERLQSQLGAAQEGQAGHPNL